MQEACVNSGYQVTVRLAIILPTYNGASYLAEQLNSLVAQTSKNFVIVIRDDGSTDNTLDVIQSFQIKYPQLIHCVKSAENNLGARGSFSYLMHYVLQHKQELNLDSAYVMFCDQDDIWHEEKVAREVSLMLQVESKAPEMPVLIHSDLSVVSQSNELIASSFIKYQGLDPRKRNTAQIALSNTVTGCTAMVNEALLERALPVPDNAVMHDWWLALIAAAFGQIEFIPESLVRYRQHEQNAVGAMQHTRAKTLDLDSAAEYLKRGPSPLFEGIADQAGLFVEKFSAELSLSTRIKLRLVKCLNIRSIVLQRVLFRLLRI